MLSWDAIPLQVRKTFEDLYAEALRINEGRPSLAPYAEVGAALVSLAWERWLRAASHMQCTAAVQHRYMPCMRMHLPL